MRRMVATLVAGLTLALAVSACAGGGTRTIEVRMFDDMRYDPATFNPRAGETIRFAVTNAGQLQHEFFIGDVEAHEQHASEMRDTQHEDAAHETSSGVRVGPGQTAILEYTFAEPAELVAACHEPGHYEAGMLATIIVH